MNIIKSVIKSISKPLVYICNLSLRSGIFPDDMKIARVISLYKTREKNLFTNYRPVTLLPQFSKILEKIYYSRLDKFISKHDILSNSQYGFRQNMSTNLALLELVEELTSSIDKKNKTIGVFIDLKKAFDTIDHDILLKKLDRYGVRGISNNWMKSYMTGRKQYVNIDIATSGMLQTVCGVPQGSVLGPQLFLLYINDICNVSKLIKCILFADDTNLFFSGKCIKYICKVMSMELIKFNSWFALNKLSLNISKTNYIVFGIVDKDELINVSIDELILPRVFSTKFLGVQIDEGLNWKEHIKLVTSKLIKVSGIIFRTNRVLNYDSLHTLYFLLFLPYINYCSEILTTMKSMTVSVAGVKLWNSLKTNITTIKKNCVYKKMCKFYFLGKYMNYT